MSRHALRRSARSGPSASLPPAAEVVERELASLAVDGGYFAETGPIANGPPPPPRIPPGQYEATSVSAKPKTFKFGAKVVEKFVLALRITGDPRVPPGGVTLDFIKLVKFTPKSDYYRAWVLAKGHEPHRTDKMVMSVFRNHRFLILVEDSTKDSRGYPLAAVNRYSRVAALLEKIA